MQLPNNFLGKSRITAFTVLLLALPAGGSINAQTPQSADSSSSAGTMQDPPNPSQGVSKAASKPAESAKPVGKKSTRKFTSDPAAAMNTDSSSIAMARRLPRYFGAVVDVRQRETIYQIQARYRLQLDELERQLAAVKQAERAEIEGLLTSEQLVRLEELRSPSQVASSRSASGRAGEGDPTEPSTPSGAKGENGGADGPKEQPRVGSPT